jgi:hypothetical protein
MAPVSRLQAKENRRNGLETSVETTTANSQHRRMAVAGTLHTVLKLVEQNGEQNYGSRHKIPG